MKKLIALAMAGLMTATAFAGCGGSNDKKDSKADEKPATASEATNDSAAGDWKYIADKGSMTIGITYFEPMNYKDKDGKLVGFETEFSEAVCEELGVTAKFQEIEWDSKEIELSSKTIDCIWNGLTITDERKANMSITNPYMENKQVMVCKKENVEKFSTAEGVSGANVVAEAGSAGEDVGKQDKFFAEANFESVESQATALLEVKAGTADIAIIDYVMSIGTLRSGSDFENLSMVEAQSFSPEQYGIAFRKGSDATAKVNDAMKKLAENGKLKAIADKYNLTDLLLIK